LPLTGQAVITDIGEANDIHPKNKWEVGRRLSLHALKDIYGKDVQASSPRVAEIEVHDDMAELSFTETGSGLTVKQVDGERYPIVKSLTVQDEKGDWHWAVGTLDERTNLLRVINPAGTPIQKVRYAWFDNPDDANLFSREGLPVTPFEIEAR
jgi:sialate O-acetylesterase